MTVWRENFRGRVDGLLARSLERLRSDVANLQRNLDRVARQAANTLSFSAIRTALQAGGEAPLNVQGLLGRLAQPQTGGAPALENFPSTADPITQDGALFVLKGATNQLYRVKGDTEPETFELIGGAAGVTSVDATVPPEFNVSGVPITTSGTIAIGKEEQDPNTVWAGPTSGVPAEPTFRALTLDDLPSGVGSDPVQVQVFNRRVAAELPNLGQAATTFNPLEATVFAKRAVAELPSYIVAPPPINQIEVALFSQRVAAQLPDLGFANSRPPMDILQNQVFN